MQASANFATEMNKLGATAESIKNSIGDELAKALTGPAKKLNDWLGKNDGKIKDTIDKIGDKTEELVNKIGDWWDKNGDAVLDTLRLIGSGVMTIIGWLTSEKAKKGLKGVKEQMSVAWDTAKNMAVSLWTGDGQFLQVMQDGMDNMLEAAKHTVGIEDGIIRPDGRVTPIAPDDWVFAARDVGDMAKAFIPQGMTSAGAPAQYSITQNFTISGSNDIPQVIKQQAYRGTQEGLMAIMAQSSQRLQMMSGTR
jgi:hypothetical protein